jgi:carbamoylphosphate synthase small subunit
LRAVHPAQQVRQAHPSARLYGYAQHVMTEIIDRATYAGYDEVLTRGQFDRQFARWMA